MKGSIPDTTICRYVDSVVGIPKFNMMNTVSNKTESHRAAEWSIRSTISYILVVLTSTHYINAKPSKYHKPFKELSKDPTYNMVRELNKDVLQINTSNESTYHLTHALTDLITTTYL
jgi:hypothetical protein